MTALKRIGTALRGGEGILPAALVAMGLYWVIEALRLGIWNRLLPGSGLMPLIYGSLLVMFALCVLYAIGQDEGEEVGPVRKPLLLVGLLILTVLGFPLLGGTVSLFLLIAVIYTVIERLPVARALAVAACTSAVFYGVFDRWLSVSLPHGPWGF